MGKNLANTTHTFLFCDGGSCQKAGSENAARAARAYLRNNGHWDNTHTIRTRCNGRCEDAPTCIVQSGNYWYKQLTPETAVEIVKSHLENNQPLQQELLFKEGWKSLQSDKEIAPFMPKPFELKNEEEFGQCWTTKGFSSDQYLHPLFLFLSEQLPKGKLTLTNGDVVELKNLQSVSYTEKYVITLTFLDNKTTNLIIGVLPKTAPLELIEQKITSTEYFLSLKSGELSILFKNKKGNRIASITLDKTEKEILKYCLKIQLRGLVIPKLAEKTNIE